MRYVLDDDGYLYDVSIGSEIECDLGTCTEYTGAIPSGYETIDEWFLEESDSLNAWKIIDNNLVFDNARYKRLQDLWQKQEEDNSPVLHKEIFNMKQQIEDICDVSESQYKKSTARGRVIKIDNVKKVYPRIKLTNIDPYSYSDIDLIATGKNMLRNDATTQTISGITFTQNEDRSITINGTSTAAIEYNIAGTSDNTSAFLCFKKNLSYYLSGLNNQTLKMYNYDGADREEVYNGTGGRITFTDSDKLVTQIILSIDSGTTINKLTIYPQLEYGTTSTDYEEYKGTSILSFGFGEYIKQGLFPSDTLYPSDDLYPYGSSVDYILIESNDITSLIDDNLIEISNGSLTLFNGCNTVYTLQDTMIEIEYSINVLEIDNLDYMRGKSTTTNKFKVLEDGSIEAHNGYFSGTIEATDGKFSGEVIATSGKFNGEVNATGGTFNGEVNATSGTIGGCSISDGVLKVKNANIEGTIATSKLDSDVITTSNFSAQNINADKITSGTLSADLINGGTINASNINMQGVTLSPSYSSVGGLTIANGNISNNRLGLDGNDGIVKVFNSAGGSMILSNAARLSATAGIGLTSNSTGNVSAPSVNLDLKACSGASAYIGSMINADGTGEKSGITCSNGILEFRSTGYCTYNGTSVFGSSSKATKKNIVDLTQNQKDEVYELIKQVPTKQYDYKEEYGKPFNYGFIIEDIEGTKLKDLLHITQAENNKDIKMYSTEDLVRLELITIQELMKKVETLENKIKELEER